MLSLLFGALVGAFDAGCFGSSNGYGGSYSSDYYDDDDDDDDDMYERLKPNTRVWHDNYGDNYNEFDDDDDD